MIPNHKIVWAGIESFAHKHNLSCSGLAKLSGMDATTFNRSKRTTHYGKERWPSMQSIVKVVQATNSSFEDFVECMRDEFLKQQEKSKGN